jgi:hypothetical protein
MSDHHVYPPKEYKSSTASSSIRRSDQCVQQLQPNYALIKANMPIQSFADDIKRTMGILPQTENCCSEWPSATKIICSGGDDGNDWKLESPVFGTYEFHPESHKLIPLVRSYFMTDFEYQTFRIEEKCRVSQKDAQNALLYYNDMDVAMGVLLLDAPSREIAKN